MEDKTRNWLENRQEKIRITRTGNPEELQGNTGAEPVFKTVIQEKLSVN